MFASVNFCVWKQLKVTLGLACTIVMLAISSSIASDRPYGLGKLATAEEVAGWDIDVRPDGKGAPVGVGTAALGEEIYTERCAACHGDFGEGIDRWPVLVGGQGTLNSHDPVKTVGSYWPYASTIYDYVYRAMPFGEAQSLTHDETYSVVAYLLFMNDVIEEDLQLSNANIGSIKMPNREGFMLPDPRPDGQPQGEPCMKNCSVSTKIIGKARNIDVTPES